MNWLLENKDNLYFAGGMLLFLIGRFWPAFSVKISLMLWKYGQFDATKKVLAIFKWVEENVVDDNALRQKTAVTKLQDEYKKVTGQDMPDSIATRVVTTLWDTYKKVVKKAVGE